MSQGQIVPDLQQREKTIQMICALFSHTAALEQVPKLGLGKLKALYCMTTRNHCAELCR